MKKKKKPNKQQQTKTTNKKYIYIFTPKLQKNKNNRQYLYDKGQKQKGGKYNIERLNEKIKNFLFCTLNFHRAHAFYNMDWKVVAKKRMNNNPKIVNDI